MLDGWRALCHAALGDRDAAMRSLREMMAAPDGRPDEHRAALLACVDALAEAAWPGERLVGTPARDRVYAAVSRLRRSGLDGAIGPKVTARPAG